MSVSFQNTASDNTKNITSFTFNNLYAVTIAKLKMNSSQNSAIITYKKDIGHNGKIIQYQTIKFYFPGNQSNQSDTSEIYNKTNRKLVICSITNNQKNEQKL